MPKDDVPRGEFSQDTPTDVGGDPLLTLVRRTKKTATDARQSLDATNSMREELREAVQRDEREHNLIHQSIRSIDERLTEELGSVRKQQMMTDGKVDGVASQLANLRVDHATANVQLVGLLDDIKAEKRDHEHAQRVARETAGVVEQVDVKDKADSKRIRRRKSLKIWSIATSLFGAGGLISLAISYLLGRC